MATPEFDVVIVGGGLVGASLALALRDAPLRVALLEAAAPPSAPPSWDERCIALNARSREIFEELGAWAALAPDAEPIVSTHISEQGRFGVARFAAAEAGLPALGYNTPLRAIGQCLWQRVQQTPTALRCPARVTRIDVSAQEATLAVAGEGDAEIRARLVVAADGAHSSVRALLGIGERSRDYAQHAIVTAVRCTRPHRGCAYERFTPDGPIALLPKPEDACSLVWTVPGERSAALLAAPDAEFLARAQDAFGERLGRLSVLGRRNAHPLTQVMADALTAPRVLFVGNAAQSLHPVAAQGFNLGLRDVAALAQRLRGAADPGAAELLASHAADREADRRRTADFTDGLIRTFSNRVPGFWRLRHLGLLALDLLPPLKSQVMWQSLGYAAAAPRR